jgi:uncharacterized membrane protein YkoI
MQINRNYLAIGASVVAIAATGTGVAMATSGGEDAGEQATGPGVAQARTAALDVTGGGTANSVELDDENGATWEVEVTKPDGETVDVRLDDQYKVVVVEGDSEDAGDAE